MTDMTARITVQVIEPNGKETETEFMSFTPAHFTDDIESATELIQEALDKGFTVWWQAGFDNNYTYPFGKFDEQEVQQANSLRKWVNENWKG